MFLEYAHVPECSAARGEGEAVPAHRPAVGGARRDQLPLAGAVFIRSFRCKPGVGFPALHGPCRFPEGLRVGADDALAAKAFELLQVAGIEEGVVLPVIGDKEAGFGFHPA
jgi:hypothetical protein